MNIPNAITIARILLVPLTVWLLISSAYDAAFLVFLAAGVSDGVDGYIARHMKTQSDLGAYLDPLADKALLVSSFATLGIIKAIPAWLVLLVITRDVLIVGGVLLAWLVDRPLEIKPSLLSKLNTVVQISYVGIVLGVLALSWQASEPLLLAAFAVAATTALSGAQYLYAWFQHVSAETAT
jgi:cardiolipin synthase (CMP-forming)